MKPIRLYVDEDAFQESLVLAFKSSGIDVITVADVERLSLSDEEQLMWATACGRTIYSFNIRDFYQLHALFLSRSKTHSGIILVPQQRYSIGEQLRGLLQLIAENSAEQMVDRLVFLSTYIRDR